MEPGAPTPGRRKAQTALQNIEERLRRAFSLVGEVGTIFRPELVTPVVIVADATQPGNNFLEGRRWSGTYLATCAAASYLALEFRQRSVIDGIALYATTAASDFQFAIAPADAGAIAGVTNLTTPWIELQQRNTDRAPILNSAIAAGAAVGVPFHRGLTQANTIKAWEPLYGMSIEAGGRLVASVVNAAGWGTAYLNVWGRT